MADTGKQPMADVEVVDLAPVLAGDVNSAAYKDMAARTASSFKKTGVVIVRDPRVTFESNDSFIDNM